jgi:hypothetical protein
LGEEGGGHQGHKYTTGGGKKRSDH